MKTIEIELGPDRPIVECELWDNGDMRFVVWPCKDSDSPCHTTILRGGCSREQLRKIAGDIANNHSLTDSQLFDS